jgi:hypothetical protein
LTTPAEASGSAGVFVFRRLEIPEDDLQIGAGAGEKKEGPVETPYGTFGDDQGTPLEKSEAPLAIEPGAIENSGLVLFEGEAADSLGQATVAPSQDSVVQALGSMLAEKVRNLLFEIHHRREVRQVHELASLEIQASGDELLLLAPGHRQLSGDHHVVIRFADERVEVLDRLEIGAELGENLIQRGQGSLCTVESSVVLERIIEAMNPLAMLPRCQLPGSSGMPHPPHPLAVLQRAVSTNSNAAGATTAH